MVALDKGKLSKLQALEVDMMEEDITELSFEYKYMAAGLLEDLQLACDTRNIELVLDVADDSED